MITFVDVNTVLPALIRAVGETYPKDKTRPSVLTAYIEEKKLWYVSIVRYVDGTNSRQVITSAYNADLLTALTRMAEGFLNISSEPEFRRALKMLIS